MRNIFFRSKHFVGTIFTVCVLVIAFLLSVTLVACNDNKGVKLLFSDEFDSNKLDLSKWTVHGKDLAAGELRRGGWWTEDSVFLEDGKLVIRTVYDKNKNTFYTGCIDSKKLMTYGYYEARCKLPEANGMWSAFWIMCEKMNLGNPDASVGGAEIDIFESPFYSYKGGCVQHAIHTGGYGDNHHQRFSFPYRTMYRPEGVENAYAEWHTFALDWQPDGYRFYIDGVLSWETVDPYGSKGSEDYKENNVSSVPSYIMLSVEVGGENGEPGDTPFVPLSNPLSDNGDMDNFFVDFLVDYVRVYESYPYAD